MMKDQPQLQPVMQVTPFILLFLQFLRTDKQTNASAPL